MKKEECRSQIVGKISAHPNPVPYDHEYVIISWETNDPAGGEVRVSTSAGEEKLVSRGSSGEAKISWVKAAAVYDFRLYASSKPGAPIDAIQVTRTSEPTCPVLQRLATQVLRGEVAPLELARFIATVMPHILKSPKYREIFSLWEQNGFHVTPVHFYQPIPDTRTLRDMLWDQPSKLVGIEMNANAQLDLLRNHFPKFRDEYEQLPTQPVENQKRFHLNNGLFDGVDALTAYCMVRYFQPRLIIEVGSGFSSLILGEAAVKNHKTAIVCIEPYPMAFLRQGFPWLHELIEANVQDVNLEFFSKLGSNDILFIDSSHTVKVGSDVNYLFLEVLPRLKPGVIVHIHDVFLPFEYRRDWVIDELRFWSEQYLLQAFLTFNSEFEVLLANNYLSHYHQAHLKNAFPFLQDLKTVFTRLRMWQGGSFWMRRKPGATRPEGNATAIGNPGEI